jgi:NAD(P)-dependent dehydrogenase (short-subunit alcohol dehydrogenase family)
MPLQRPLHEAVVVITGASSGIGSATAHELAARGAAVVVAARGSDALQTVADDCRRLGGRAIAVPTDVADPDEVQDLAARAVTEYGRIDAWVNNAGVSVYGLIDQVPAEEFRRVIEVDLLGTAYGVQAALPYLVAAGGGVLVNNASVLAEVTMPYQAAYNAAKHGVRGLSDTLRQELWITGHREVSVCTVLPAAIDTPFFRAAANHTGRPLRPPPPVHPPDLVARTIAKLLVHPRREVYAGRAAALLRMSWRLLPGTTERLLAGYGARAQFRRGTAPVTSGNLFEPRGGADPSGHWGARRHPLRTTAAVGAVAGAAAAIACRQARMRS